MGRYQMDRLRRRIVSELTWEQKSLSAQLKSARLAEDRRPYGEEGHKPTSEDVKMAENSSVKEEAEEFPEESGVIGLLEERLELVKKKLKLIAQRT